MSEDHKTIWLEPNCEDLGKDRQWCQDDVWGKCDECGQPSVKYIRADLVASHAQCGAAKVNGLGWLETNVDRGDGSSEFSGFEAETPFGTWYLIEIENDYFTVEHDLAEIGRADSPDLAKEIAQRDFEQRIAWAMAPGAHIGCLTPAASTDLVHKLRQLDDGVSRPVSILERNVCSEAAAQIERLAAQVESARVSLETIARTTFSGSEMDDSYMRGNRDAHVVCASMARNAILGLSHTSTVRASE